MLATGFYISAYPMMKGHSIDKKINQNIDLSDSDMRWIHFNWWRWGDNIIHKKNYRDYAKALLTGLCKHDQFSLGVDVVHMAIRAADSDPDSYREMLAIVLDEERGRPNRFLIYSMVLHAPSKSIEHAGLSNARAALQQFWSEINHVKANNAHTVQP